MRANKQTKHIAFSSHLRGYSELKIILSGYDELANATETLIHWNYNKILQMRLRNENILF